MKARLLWPVCLVVICFICFSSPMETIAQEGADNLIDQLQAEYERVKPPSPTSSINSDYPIRQTAIGIFYSAKMMSHLIKQGQILNNKYDQFLEINQTLIERYDSIIKQNDEIIRLLNIIAEKAEQNENKEEKIETSTEK